MEASHRTLLYYSRIHYISGVWEEKDLLTISSLCDKGDFRSGPALLSWIMSFDQSAAVSVQSKLISKVESARTPASAPKPNFEEFVNQLLLDWLKIQSNKASEPAAFYHLLLNAFPNGDIGKLAPLKSC